MPLCTALHFSYPAAVYNFRIRLLYSKKTDRFRMESEIIKVERH